MARASNASTLNLAASLLHMHAACGEGTMSSELSELKQQCEQSEWELEYDDGPSTFKYICMSSGSFSNSNHSTDVPSLLSGLKQPPLASTNRKKWLRVFPMGGNATSE